MLPTSLSPTWIWSISGALFFAGCLCLVLRRQFLAMIFGVELLVNSANLAIVYYAVRNQDPGALAVALLVVAIAAAEVVVGISLILALDRRSGTDSTEEVRSLAG